MLKSLFVQNYALINQLEISFGDGLSIISGETGAGKSILLGALSLILGQRADTSVLYDKSKKCIVEGSFEIKGYGLEEILEDNQVDYDPVMILRREVSDAGKSRAFVNDTPVSLNVMRELGTRLVDIHSQHQNLMLGENAFQLQVIDTVAGQLEEVASFTQLYYRYRSLRQRVELLEQEAGKNKADLDYFQFQYDQLEKAALQEGEQELLEAEMKTLLHAEEIKGSLLQVHGMLAGDDHPLVSGLREAMATLQRLVPFFPQAEALVQRLESGYIELKDLALESEHLGNTIDYDPQRIEQLQQRLDTLYTLQQKHRVTTITHLLEIQAELKEKISRISGVDLDLERSVKELQEMENTLARQADRLSEQRRAVFPAIEKTLSDQLKQLGMPNGRFAIEHSRLGQFSSRGTDQVQFLFSANKQGSLMELSKVASGGELSRVMLCLKSLLTRSLALPTIIFDEIDAGVSGEIADKVGNIIRDMSAHMQVINITHLPQIASKGERHYLVFKTEDAHRSLTQVKQLNAKERILEIARMLSGEDVTEAAIRNAKELLKGVKSEE